MDEFAREAAGDVGVGIAAADVLADAVDDQDVDLVERQPRQIGHRFLEQRRLALQDLVCRQRDDPTRRFVRVFQNREAEGDLAGGEDQQCGVGDVRTQSAPAE